VIFAAAVANDEARGSMVAHERSLAQAGHSALLEGIGCFGIANAKGDEPP